MRLGQAFAILASAPPALVVTTALRSHLTLAAMRRQPRYARALMQEAMARKCPECDSALERAPDAHVFVCPECDYEEPEDDGGDDGDLETREDSHAQLDDDTWGAVSDREHVIEEAVTEYEYDEPRPECGADAAAGCPKCYGIRRARRPGFLKILGAIAAGVTIVAGVVYVATFLR